MVDEAVLLLRIYLKIKNILLKKEDEVNQKSPGLEGFLTNKNILMLCIYLYVMTIFI